FLFAVEAKAARYGRVAGPGSDVRAAKALPADSPELVERGVAALDPTRPQISFVAIVAITAGCLLGTLVAPSETFRGRPPVFSAAYFSPPAFVRPPPAL